MDTELFAEWLFCGLGCPYLYLQGHDSTPYHQALLHACLYNPVYDRQCEGTRAEYLFGLIALSHDPSTFQKQIIDAFATPDDAMDLEQLFDFALLFAQAGDPRSRQLMYEQFSAHAGDGNDFGATQLIDLDGIDGFRFVAARLGEAASVDPDFWDSNHLLRHLQERPSGATTDSDIAALSAADPMIQQYLKIVATTEAGRRQASQQRQDRRHQAYAKLKEHLLSKQKRPSYFQLKQWGLHASDQDLAAAAHDLLEQDQPLTLAAYLAIFAQRAFPLGFQPLLPFVRHTHERVARWTLHALSLFQSPLLRDLGLALLQDNWHRSDALDLFLLNYQPGDEAVFIRLLDAVQTPDEVHALSFGLIDVLGRNTVLQAFTLRSMIYERQPCSLCRAKVVQQLITTQSIPDWMIQECQYDADEATRSAVAIYQKQKRATDHALRAGYR
jgi:hypothetical protein